MFNWETSCLSRREAATRHRPGTGFTLTEILLVLAIVIILASLCFAVLGRVRERGRSSVCQSNLKQIAAAVQLYCQDNGGYYPPATENFTLDMYLTRGGASIFTCFDCPSQPWDAEISADDQYDYDYNQALLRDYKLNPDGSMQMLGKNEAEFKESSVIWLDTDRPDSKGTHRVEVTPSKEGHPCSFTNWHSGGANFSFIDGHVKWLTPVAACDTDNQSPQRGKP